MTSIASTVTTATGLRALASGKPAAAAPPDRPGIDEFQASSPDKNRAGFETAYNAVSVLETVTRSAARAGQFYTVVGGLAGMPASGLAGVLTLVGGTYDVAIGSSIGKQSAVNRNGAGALAGNLQVAQGIASLAAVAGPALGAPPVVATVAAGVAAGAFAGRLGVQAYAKFKAAKAEKAEQEAKAQAAAAPPAAATPQAPAPAPADPAKGEPTQVGSSRKFEKAFAFSQANDAFFRGLGGMGAFWTNVDAIRGQQPGGVFGMLGFVGGTYSVLSGVSTAKASAINRNVDGTVQGTLQTVQGVATLATAMGMGRPAAIVAAGAWAARTAWSIYQQVKAVAGDKDESQAAEQAAPASAPAVAEAPKQEETAQA